ncbi:hypothetical protein SLOPH_1855 [Spraguea lophii 42_110]|uniref:FHA domain-containing protein n=1 Tax=Spraguea lophii (strain 42_110) TaxID=1358809 RepID=S7XSD3_SPRLO|nr:hypothetical protein SLOPH_1855 [Spraguea lophii 42_110]
MYRITIVLSSDNFNHVDVDTNKNFDITDINSDKSKNKNISFILKKDILTIGSSLLCDIRIQLPTVMDEHVIVYLKEGVCVIKGDDVKIGGVFKNGKVEYNMGDTLEVKGRKIKAERLGDKTNKKSLVYKSGKKKRNEELKVPVDKTDSKLLQIEDNAVDMVDVPTDADVLEDNEIVEEVDVNEQQELSSEIEEEIEREIEKEVQDEIEDEIEENYINEGTYAIPEIRPLEDQIEEINTYPLVQEPSNEVVYEEEEVKEEYIEINKHAIINTIREEVGEAMDDLVEDIDEAMEEMKEEIKEEITNDIKNEIDVKEEMEAIKDKTKKEIKNVAKNSKKQITEAKNKSKKEINKTAKEEKKEIKKQTNKSKKAIKEEDNVIEEKQEKKRGRPAGTKKNENKKKTKKK